MPFKSHAQRRACWAQYNRDIKSGKVPMWDCEKYEKKTKVVLCGAKTVEGKPCRKPVKGKNKRCVVHKYKKLNSII